MRKRNVAYWQVKFTNLLGLPLRNFIFTICRLRLHRVPVDRAHYWCSRVYLNIEQCSHGVKIPISKVAKKGHRNQFIFYFSFLFHTGGFRTLLIYIYLFNHFFIHSFIRAFKTAFFFSKREGGDHGHIGNHFQIHTVKYSLYNVKIYNQRFQGKRQD